jgi:hypothetical protein
MTPQELLATFRDAGWGPGFDIMITAIALRESAGIPTAYNGNVATGDDSCGLCQINWKVPSIVASLETIGITDKTQLFDPATNARAAWHLSGGDSATAEERLANMRLLWYFDRMLPGPATEMVPSSYKLRYESHLSAVILAAAELS